MTDNITGEFRRHGRIEVICGSMFSGKTEELIRRLKRAKFAKQQVEIFKPSIDTRYSDVDVVSHDQNTIQSTPIDSSGSILLLAGENEVIGIDEAQFLDNGLVDVCNQLANRGIRVIIAGLDMDFKGKPFGPMPALSATALWQATSACCSERLKSTNRSAVSAIRKQRTKIHNSNFAIRNSQLQYV